MGAVATIGAAALLLAALVVVIGSAQAAPLSKKYDASVRVTDGLVDVPDGETVAVSATLRLTLTNRGKQTLGSADFDPPDGVIPPAPPDNEFATSKPGWTATFEEGVVKFRSPTGPALTKDQDVWADVPVTVDGCTDALWKTEAKQSNDFSGQPGNSFLPGVLDLTPLGSFVVAPPIQTEKGGQTIPALETGTSFEWTATAYDLCGNVKTSYSGATLSSTFLTDAIYVPGGGDVLDWGVDNDGIGRVTFTPTVTETGNQLTVTDPDTDVTESSNVFDVSDTLCVPAPPGQAGSCHWDVVDDRGKLAIEADAASPTGSANLGIGFNANLNFECNNTDEPVGDSVVNINPRGYTLPFTVSLTYKKSATGNGPASNFVVCFSKDDDGSDWDTMESCPSTPVADNAPCIQTQKRTSSGDLLIVLYLIQEDPWTGLG